MTRKPPTPLEVATRIAEQRERPPATSPALPHYGRYRPRGGLAFRLLKCDRCESVWPTERDEAHGGSRLDGEPCAYRWPDGRVCTGHVHPLGYQPPQWEDEPAPRRRPMGAWSEGDGAWCAVLGLPRGTRDLGTVRQAYRRLAKVRHPDQGGTHDAMRALNDAYAAALAELGQP